MSTSSKRTSDNVLRSTVLPGSIVCSRTLSSIQELTNCEHARAHARLKSAVVPACIAQARILHLHLLQLRVVGQVGAPLQLVARRGQQLRLLVQVH